MLRQVLERVKGTAVGMVVQPQPVEARPVEAQPQEAVSRETHRHAVHLPPVWSLVRHGGVRIAEATLVPLGLFYLLLQPVGLRWALIAALGWSYLVIAVRLVRRERVSALLLIGTAMLTVRSAVSFATGSAFFYFLQPTLGNFVVGALFLLSVPLGRPLAGRLASELCPLPAHVLDRRAVRSFFTRITVLWALVNIANGSTALWALLSSSLGGVLLARTLGSLTIVGAAICLSYVWFRRSLRVEGLTLTWGVPA
jgi:intracellular septation protein A